MKQLLAFFIIFLCVKTNAQSNYIILNAGYSIRNYQFDLGDGYNLAIGYEREFKNQKFAFGTQLVLSNTYAASFLDYERDFDFKIGGANYVDFPNGVTKFIFPIDNGTYLEYAENGYLKQYKPKESFYHDLLIDIYVSFKILDKKSFTWRLNSGIGIGLSNTAETISSYESFYPYGPENKEDGVFLLNKVERLTKHIALNLSFANSFSYKLNKNYEVVLKQNMFIVPKLLFSYTDLTSALYIFNLGLKMKMSSFK